MDKSTAIVLGLTAPVMLFVVTHSVGKSVMAPTSRPAPVAETAQAEIAQEGSQDGGAPETVDAAPQDVASTNPVAEPIAEDPEVAVEAPVEPRPPADAVDAEPQVAEEVPAEEATVTELQDAAAPAPDATMSALAGDPDAGQKIWRQCGSCHVADTEQNRVGPHLVGILGRDIASVAGVRYSQALLDLEGRWTPEALDAWLENPKAFAPGSRMAYRGLKDPEDRNNLIAYLARLAEQ